MSKYKIGAIVKEVSKGAEKWYEMAGWKKLASQKTKKEQEIDKTDSKENATT